MHRQIIMPQLKLSIKMAIFISVMYEPLGLLHFIIKVINVYPVYKNTGESFVQTDAGIKLLESDTWTRSKRFSIVNAAFSDSEKQRIKGYDFNIKMYINSSTGRVDEVSFEFHRSGPFATIPVSVYRKIETEIKKELWFTLTAEGKMLSYIFYWWAQEPK